MDEVTELLKQAIALEMRGVELYSYLSANISGLYRTILGELFGESAKESLVHSADARMWLKALIGLSSDVMVSGDMEPGDLPMPGVGNEREFLMAAVDQESEAVNIYSRLYSILNTTKPTNIGLLNWVQAQVEVEQRDLIEYQMLLDQI